MPLRPLSVLCPWRLMHRATNGTTTRVLARRGATSVVGAGEVVDDEVAEHRAVVIAAGGGEQVAIEDRAERMAVGHAEHAVGADEHVDVDRVDVALEHALRATALEDPPDEVDGRRV